MRIGCNSQGVEFFLQALEEVKQERIKFITRILTVNQQQKESVEISQSPIQIDQGCNYYLLNAYLGVDKQNIQSYNGVNVSSYNGMNKHRLKHSSTMHKRLSSSRQLIINILYMISYWMYVPQLILPQMLNIIRKQSNDCLFHFNRLSIVHLVSVASQKKWGRQSTTAAQTKMTYDRQIMMMDSDIFDAEFGAYERSNSKELGAKHRRDNVNDIKALKTLKHNYTNNHNTNTISTNNITTTTSSSIPSRYFSRINQLQTNQFNYMHRVIHQSSSSSSNDPFHNTWYCFQALSQLFTLLYNQHKLLSLQQFHSLNRNKITNKVINQIFANYTFSLQQQYNQMDEQPIDQIKQLLDKLYQKALTQFYQLQPSLYFTTKHQQQSLNKLLALITQAQSSIFSSINKTKRQMFSRRLSTLDDYCINDSSKFQNIISQKLVTDQQIGFGLYRESIKQKLYDIFTELLDYQSGDKKTTTIYRHKSINSASSIINSHKKLYNNTTPKIISKHALSNNIDKRIQILTSQKRNLQQSLHYEQRLHENLIEYVNGQAKYQQQRINKHQIQTISESEEDIDQ